MNDLAKWKVHGPVATLRTENAEWDTDRKDWKLARYFTLTSFRRDGTVDSSETHNSGGSIGHSRWLYDSAGRLTESDSWMDDSPPQRVLYFYDEAGRHVRTAQLRADGGQTDLETCTYDGDGKQTKTRLLPVTAQGRAGNGATSIGYSIEDTDMMLGAPGATLMTTTYAGTGLPARVILEDADHNPLHGSSPELRLVRSQLRSCLHPSPQAPAPPPYMHRAVHPQLRDCPLPSPRPCRPRTMQPSPALVIRRGRPFSAELRSSTLTIASNTVSKARFALSPLRETSVGNATMGHEFSTSSKCWRDR